ncbi:aminoglycoside phosphotransferase [Clostridium sp. CAG:1013]|jgi:Ser/Thr protein kinase RdoA (MazF antagonist)|nr:aminoglycoside phosphotransferase [Clostridium sp. CAG:1013]
MKLEKVIAVRTSKTIYRDGQYVIKVFDEGYSKADILNEALNIARVEETGLPIPNVEEVTKIDGKWAIVTDYAEGKTIAQLMAENPDKKDALLERFVDIQIEVQSKTCPMLNRLKEKMKGKIAQTGLDATTRYELDSRLAAMPNHNKLCHGDFNPTNVVISPDGESYSILDWAHATQGNASADAARTYLLFWLAGEIETAEQYLNLFCKKTDTAKQYVQKWLPIVAASQSVKGKPEEREFLMHWVNVVEYE